MTTEFLPFASAVGANVETQTDYAGSSHQLSGFIAGKALSNQFNKLARQASFGTAILANYISDVLGQSIPDDGNLGNLIAKFWQALLGGNYFIDSGSSSALSVSAPGGLTFGAPFAGLRISIKAANACIGITTLNWCGTGAQPVTYHDGIQLLSGAYAIGSIIELQYDGAKWQFISAGTGLRLSSVGSTATVYVRTDGNDANDGSANNTSKAVLTLHRAYQIASRYFIPGGSVIIQFGIPGIYAMENPPLMETPIIISGDTANQANYVFQGSAFEVFGQSLTLTGLTLLNNANTNHNLTSSYSANVQVAYVTFSASSGNTTAAMKTYPGGSITLGPGIISASNQAYFGYSDGGNIILQVGGSITFSGGPVFSQAVFDSQGGHMLLAGTFSGAAGGKRYIAAANGIIDTQGGGASFIPGSIAGTVSTGGQYV